MRLSRNLSAAGIAASLAMVMAPALAEKPAEILKGAVAAKVTAMPIDFDRDNPDRKTFGKLVWRGGLNLFSDSRFFGGYSGIVIDPSGRGLLAVSDAGMWLRARLDYDGRKLKGLTDVSIGPILGRGGKPLASERERDSEGIALLSGDIAKGVAYVSFERDHRIDRYQFARDSFGPPDASLKLPAETKRMDGNRGIEGLAVISAGPMKRTLVVFSERLPDRTGGLKGWLIGGPAPGPITLRNLGGYDITDIAPLPDGGLVLLERRFRYSEGIKMRIRRIAAKELKPGATVSGEILLAAEDNLNIDNMEAIAAHRSASGEIILTLMSDDNFSALQRTLLMQFALPEGKSRLAEPGTR